MFEPRCSQPVPDPVSWPPSELLLKAASSPLVNLAIIIIIIIINKRCLTSFRVRAGAKHVLMRGEAQTVQPAVTTRSMPGKGWRSHTTARRPVAVFCPEISDARSSFFRELAKPPLTVGALCKMKEGPVSFFWRWSQSFLQSRRLERLNDRRPQFSWALVSHLSSAFARGCTDTAVGRAFQRCHTLQHRSSRACS